MKSSAAFEVHEHRDYIEVVDLDNGVSVIADIDAVLPLVQQMTSADKPVVVRDAFGGFDRIGFYGEPLYLDATSVKEALAA